MATREPAYDKILASAAKLFATKGYAATTTRMIVSEAGSSLSAIHAHFGSKEKIYEAVMERTTDLFYELNAPVLKGIRDLEQQGLMSKEAAWDQIVLLTGHMIDWVYNPEYKYEILLINQQMVGLGAEGVVLPDSFFGLYRQYASLFESYTENREGNWALKLAFYTVTSAFDGANYPDVLSKLLGADLEKLEGRDIMKFNLKTYLLTNMRAQLEPRMLSARSI